MPGANAGVRPRAGDDHHARVSTAASIRASSLGQRRCDRLAADHLGVDQLAVGRRDHAHDARPRRGVDGEHAHAAVPAVPSVASAATERRRTQTDQPRTVVIDVDADARCASRFVSRACSPHSTTTTPPELEHLVDIEQADVGVGSEPVQVDVVEDLARRRGRRDGGRRWAMRTSAGSMPMPAAMPRTRTVLPAPSSPLRRMRSPGSTRVPMRSPSASVSASVEHRAAARTPLIAKCRELVRGARHQRAPFAYRERRGRRRRADVRRP